MSAAAVSATALAGWVALALLVGLLVGVLLGRALGRSARPPDGRARASAVPAPDRPTDFLGEAYSPGPGARRPLEVDDLPSFLEHPPGSPVPGAPAAGTTAGTSTAPAAAVGATAVPATAVGVTAVAATALRARAGGVRSPTSPGRHSADALSARRTVLAMVVAATVLVGVAVLIALVSGGGSTGDAPAGSGAPGTPTSSAGTEPAAEADEVPAGALAARSVPLGEEGMTARATFGSVLLEERAVGVTVTRPALSVSTDGARSLAHLRLPTYNCLTREPPPDPEAAGCARAVTEFADLTGPALRMTRDGDRVQLTGRFPTYTRLPDRPAAYTGRSYRLTASLAADGPTREGRAPATGVLRLGPAGAATTGGPHANVLQLPG